MEVKLINGKWEAIIGDKKESYNELPPIHKKLFSILLNCELIIAKYGLPPYQIKTKKQNILDKIKNKIDSFLCMGKSLLKDEFDYEINEYNYWKK